MNGGKLLNYAPNRPRWGSLQCSPDTLAVKGRGGEEKAWPLLVKCRSPIEFGLAMGLRPIEYGHATGLHISHPLKPGVFLNKEFLLSIR